MIVLDTNVISELMREHPNMQVMQWLDGYNTHELCITAITVAEIQSGIMFLPDGKKRKNLQCNFNDFIADAFKEKIHAFDEKSAHIYSEIMSRRKREGFTMDAIDVMIASIAKKHDASIATRNVRDFEGCGIDIINPWL